MSQREELMSPAEVAEEIIQDISEYMPDIIQKVESSEGLQNENLPTKEMEGRLMYEIQDAKISMYNMHMELQDVQFPLDNAKDFSDKEKFEELLNWLSNYYNR
jgi:hypothetical protein